MYCFKWSGREDLNLRPPAPKLWVWLINLFLIKLAVTLVACCVTKCQDVTIRLAQI